MMKGIILAGGTGTRLFPNTKVISKQLLPIYDKPLIYYPLSTLLLAGIRDILIITTPADKQLFENLLGDGSNYGAAISYKVQPNPNGLAEAFLIGENFIGESSVALILGDNIFYGQGLGRKLELTKNNVKGAKLFGYYVNDPERYGVAQFGKDGNVVDLIEKPTRFVSNYALTGLYFYENDVVEKAKKISPSSRGELEITDVNKLYLDERRLDVEVLGRGVSWLDTGTHESMLEAAEFVSIVEKRQGLKIGSPEEIAFRKGYIDEDQLLKVALRYESSSYGKYLIQITEKTNYE